MKKHLLALALIYFSCQALANECNYDENNGCAVDSVCILTPPKTAHCFKKFAGKIKPISFPFESNIVIICDQGNLSPSTESHSYVSTAFALDLKPKNQFKSDIILKAGMSGKAIVFNECKTENDSCGASFGNHIKILSSDGFMLLYAHMKKINIKTGDDIKEGQIVGIMGMTGAAGYNNPHLHISMHYPWNRDVSFDYWRQTGYVPPSVPFKLKVCSGSCKKECNETTTIPSTAVQCLRKHSKSTQLCTK